MWLFRTTELEVLDRVQVDVKQWRYYGWISSGFRETGCDNVTTESKVRLVECP